MSKPSTAVKDAFVAGFNAGRAVHGDETDVKKEFEDAWKAYLSTTERYARAERRVAALRKAGKL